MDGEYLNLHRYTLIKDTNHVDLPLYSFDALVPTSSTHHLHFFLTKLIHAHAHHAHVCSICTLIRRHVK